MIYYADTSVIHIGGESAKSDGKVNNSAKQLSILQAESELLYFRKNHGLFSCILNVILVLVADCIQFFKDLIKFRMYKNTHFNSAKLTLISAFKTRMGSTPVR